VSGIDDEDPPVSPEELAEADALARVLGKQRTSKAPPLEAFATARLIQLYQPPAAGGTQLSPEDLERILQRVLAEARPPNAVAARGWLERVRQWVSAEPSRGWALAGSAMAVVAVAGVTFSLFAPMRSEPSLASRTERGPGGAPAQLPEPPLPLLRAQAAWIATASEREQFARGMRDYRSEVYLAMGDP
jgi:hypothetical protein